MKTITFKTLSILLAAVLLVAALPVTAFAEDVSPCDVLSCVHNIDVRLDITYTKISDAIHQVAIRETHFCTWCNYSELVNVYWRNEAHEFDDSVDPEVDMEGVCIYCKEMIYW